MSTKCQDKEPFVKLDEKGKASVLNYNLPQSTTYDATSYLELDLHPNFYKVNQRKPPINNYWDNLKKIPRPDLEKKIEIDPTFNKLIPAFKNYMEFRQLEFGVNKTVAKSSSTTAAKAKTTKASKGAFTSVDVAKVILASKMKEGFYPLRTVNFYGVSEFQFLPKPKKADPKLSIVLHMKMSSFLGDYGAGRTIKTFSLLPGEKTSIRLKTYQSMETVMKRAENVLDSFSESSASDLQSTLEEEVEHSNNYSKEENESSKSNYKAGGSAGLNLGFFKIGGGGGGGGSSSSSSSVNEAVSNNVRNLQESTSRHVAKSDSFREIDVNTTTETSMEAGSSQSIVRLLENVNQSRVLNFVFRQMLQEFVSLTYIHDVSFVYSTGFPSQERSCKLSGLKGLLEEVLVNKTVVNTIEGSIYTQLSSLIDHKGAKVSLIEKAVQKYSNAINPAIKAKDDIYVRVRKDLSQEYLGKTVEGIIVGTKHRMMRTPSVVVDSLLGQGDALDCYHNKVNDAEIDSLNLENKKTEKALSILDDIKDPMERAKMFQIMFGYEIEEEVE